MNPYPERGAWGGSETLLDAVLNLAIRWRSFLYTAENYGWRTLQIKIIEIRHELMILEPNVWGVHENSFKIAQNNEQS